MINPTIYIKFRVRSLGPDLSLWIRHPNVTGDVLTDVNLVMDIIRGEHWRSNVIVHKKLPKLLPRGHAIWWFDCMENVRRYMPPTVIRFRQDDVETVRVV